MIWDSEKGKWVLDLYFFPELRDELTRYKQHEKAGVDNYHGGKPVEMDLYNLLNCPADADSKEIKKEYYRVAMVHHPDKNPSSEAKMKFQEIARAYQILSDPVLRKKYDDQGNEAVAGDADQYTKLDPTLFFSLLFGSEKFEPYVGEFLLVRKISTLFNTMQGPDQEVDISSYL